MSEEKILCRKCLDSTNHAPTDLFPPEFDGYCPKCAFELMMAGELPMVDPQIWFQQISGKLERVLSHLLDEGVEVRIVTGEQALQIVSQDENGATFVSRQCMN